MSQFNDPTFGNPPPKKSSTVKIVIIVLVVLLLIFGACCGGCVAMGWFGLNVASQQMATELKDEPAVKEHLGDNLELTTNFTAIVEEQKKTPEGKQVMVFDAKGTKGSGTIIVRPREGGGLESATLRLPDGREIPIK